MDDKVSRRWQYKALDMYDRSLHKTLLDRRASECRSSESMREKQNKPFACSYRGKKINLRQPDIALADPGRYNTHTL